MPWAQSTLTLVTQVPESVGNILEALEVRHNKSSPHEARFVPPGGSSRTSNTGHNDALSNSPNKRHQPSPCHVDFKAPLERPFPDENPQEAQLLQGPPTFAALIVGGLFPGVAFALSGTSPALAF